jgi:hypothetical protein
MRITKRFLPLLFLVVFVFAFKNTQAQTVTACKDVTELNKKILEIVKAAIGKKVGRGECWDLAANALDKIEAKWDHDYAYGNPVDYKNGACIMPGDIVQFENVKLIHASGNTFFEESYMHHTAVVYEVGKNGKIKLAQQNTSEHGKKVAIDPFEFSWVQQGTISVYRATK